MSTFNKTLTICIFLLGLLPFNSTNAQKKLLPGYIISLNGDTINGGIESNWDDNPEEIRFKVHNADTITTLTPKDILAFKADIDIYISAFVNTSTPDNENNELSYESMLNTIEVNAFLLVLYEGNKSLYYFKNQFGIENFYIKGEAGLELLEYKEYLKQGDGEKAENKNYVIQLNSYLSDCSDIYSKTNLTQYNKRSLTYLFANYQNCSNSEAPKYTYSKLRSFRYGVITGLSATSLSFFSQLDYFDYLTKSNFNWSYTPVVGLSGEMFLFDRLDRWSIQNEIIFCHFSNTGLYEQRRNADEYTISHTHIAFTYVKMNNMLRFTYPMQSYSVFINAGFSNGVAVRKKNHQKTTTVFYAIENTVEKEALSQVRNFEQGILLGPGIKYQNYSCELRFELGNGMSDYMKLGSRTNRFHFILGYRFA